MAKSIVQYLKDSDFIFPIHATNKLNVYQYSVLQNNIIKNLNPYVNFKFFIQIDKPVSSLIVKAGKFKVTKVVNSGNESNVYVSVSNVKEVPLEEHNSSMVKSLVHNINLYPMITIKDNTLLNFEVDKLLRPSNFSDRSISNVRDLVYIVRKYDQDLAEALELNSELTIYEAICNIRSKED